MAKPNQNEQLGKQRVTRYFSEEFKKNKVAELDKKLTSIAEICRQYSVSHTAVYKWMYKYSLMRKKAVKLVVESQSDTCKLRAQQQHIAELERLLGQKQFEIDFLNKQLDLASQHYGVDLKKKVSGGPSVGFGHTGENTPTK